MAVRRLGRPKALKPGDLIPFYSSEEKEVWKQRHEGKATPRGAHLSTDAGTLKAEPQERQAHETRRRTVGSEVKPEEVEKT